jgi:hypothetical protein
MYYSPLEQFEPIPYFFPFKLGFFYIFGTNVTYILILLIGIFFFINGSFWSIFKIKQKNEDLYNYLFFINKSNNSVSFFKLITLPFNYIVFFYKNIIFSFFFKLSNSLFKSISSLESILLINYKKNLFKSFRNYSVDFSSMYYFFNFKTLNKENLSFSLASYNFFLIKKIESESRNNYLIYFFRLFFFLSFFLKSLCLIYII